MGNAASSCGTDNDGQFCAIFRGMVTATRRTTPTGEYGTPRNRPTDCPIAWHFQRADLGTQDRNASDLASWSSWALAMLAGTVFDPSENASRTSGIRHVG